MQAAAPDTHHTPSYHRAVPPPHPIHMKWTLIRSAKRVQGWAYDAASRTLALAYTGRVDRYRDVPPDIADALRKCPRTADRVIKAQVVGHFQTL